jgi:hypothetical protein
VWEILKKKGKETKEKKTNRRQDKWNSFVTMWRVVEIGLQDWLKWMRQLGEKLLMMSKY